MLQIGNDWQLFVDRRFVDRSQGVELMLHQPTPRETVWRPEMPWEDDVSWFPNVIKDGDRYRMWYRAERSDRPGRRWDCTGYMESADGIHWERPKLGLVEFDASRENNLVWPLPDTGGACLCVFEDANPTVPSDERYKAIAKDNRVMPGIIGLVSADGIHWRYAQDRSIIPPPESDPHFDSPNIAFWDPWLERYAAYVRGWNPAPPESLRPDHPYGSRPHERMNRTVRRATSADFRHWTDLEYLDLSLANQPREQFYTNSTMPYLRSRDLYLMFPMRYIQERTPNPSWIHPGLSDIVFLSSRDGIHWDRTFREAWLRPGLDEDNWHERSMAVGNGIVQTGPTELSLYVVDHFRTPNLRFIRVTVRPDGLASAHTGFAGGELTTPLLSLTGSRLKINYSTSAMGTIRVEIQDAEGRAVPGFGLSDSAEMFGDELDRTVTWQGQSDLSTLAGQPVRLRFWLSDADLHAFQCI